MASVRLGAIWLNDTDDPADGLALVYVRSFQKQADKPARVVRGAAGRRRVFTRAGVDRSWSLTFGSVTRTQRAWLEGHLGRVLCIRDDRGGKMFGAYVSLPGVERTWSKDADQVSVEFQELTYSEAV